MRARRGSRDDRRRLDGATSPMHGSPGPSPAMAAAAAAAAAAAGATASPLGSAPQQPPQSISAAAATATSLFAASGSTGIGGMLQLAPLPLPGPAFNGPPGLPHHMQGYTSVGSPGSPLSMSPTGGGPHSPYQSLSRGPL